MQLSDVVQTVVQVLSSPAWGGVGGFASLVSIPLSILLASRSQSRQPHFAIASPKKSY